MPIIALEVTRTNPPSTIRGTYSLPVSIGRGSGCDIQLEADNRAISRVHVEIVEERGHSVAYNRASNLDATRCNERSLAPNERVELVQGDVLAIFGTEIKLLPPATLGLLIARRTDLKPVGDYHLLPGTAILAIETAHELLVERVADVAAIDMDEIGDRLAVLFYFDGSEPTLAILSNPEASPVLLDRGIVDQPALYLQPEDTIEVGNYRYEVMTVGLASVICENPGCQVLNAYDRGETCRICGTRLFGPTRLLRVRKL
jgi:hypothetical protein